MNTKDVFNFPIHLGTYDEFVEEILQLAICGTSSYVCVASVHQLVEAYYNPLYSSISRGATIVTPDGMPITWALKLLYKIKQQRIAGMDLMPDLLSGAAKKDIPVYIYGGTQKMLDSTNMYIKENFPNLILAGLYSPPFRLMSAEEDEVVCNLINQSGAQLVFVVLGCPKQECWMASMKGKINAAMVGIGAAVPVMIGLQKRAPRWMQHSGLEWLYRLYQEPRRLWKRYFITNNVFLYLLIKEKMKLMLRKFISVFIPQGKLQVLPKEYESINNRNGIANHKKAS